MKKILAVMAITGALAACQSDAQSERAVTGGLIGAGAGAAVGGLATGRASGALAGAAIGGAGGAIIGAGTAPRDRYYRGGRWCSGYDDFGQPIRYRC